METQNTYEFAKAGDFVLEHGDMQEFRFKYELHHEVIGTGGFAKVKRATLRVNGE